MRTPVASAAPVLRADSNEPGSTSFRAHTARESRRLTSRSWKFPAARGAGRSDDLEHLRTKQAPVDGACFVAVGSARARSGDVRARRPDHELPGASPRVLDGCDARGGRAGGKGVGEADGGGWGGQA